MAGREKSSSMISIASSFSTLLLEAWKKWDVRTMVLFSLTLQIILCVLGSRRKHTISSFSKIILSFAYLSADWIAIATLGKLSKSSVGPPTTNVLRAYWAPLLLLHLGGPDTIVVYAFEDSKFWIRHFFTLVVKAILAIYVISLSWTSSWISFLINIPLILVGIAKYVERILCLKWNNSHKRKPVISNIFNYQSPQFTDFLIETNPILWQGYALFIFMRPDVNEYLFNRPSAEIRIKTYLQEAIGTEGLDAFLVMFTHRRLDPENAFEVIAAELGFMFDLLYTKVSLLYTTLGCYLRLFSSANSFSILLLFFLSIIEQPKFNFSKVDIAITGILLTGAIVLELYAAWVMLSSDWAILIANSHHNVLVRKMFKAALKCFPFLLHRRKRWSKKMGRFDLLEYCLRYKKRKENQSCCILRKITNCSEIIEMWHKSGFTKFDSVPDHLMKSATYNDPLASLCFDQRLSDQASRGQRALENRQQYDRLKWSIESDFDYSIIVWHLATSVCYLQEDLDAPTEAMTISKHVSDYMMYLLAMCPDLILGEDNKSFWLDHTYDKLKELLFSATDIRNAASTLLLVDEEEPESSATPLENLQEDVWKLATILMESEHKWEVIKDVWIEMLVYAAVSSLHISHVKRLGEGIEFLSLIWLLSICSSFDSENVPMIEVA